jgi:hypothetical protein
VSDRAKAAALTAVLFAAIAVLYAITFSFRAITDTDLNSQQTRALVLHGDVDLARYAELSGIEGQYIHVDGHVYSTYGVGISLVASPIYLPLVHLGASDHLLQGSVGVLYAAGAAVLFHRVLRGLFDATLAAAGTIVFTFGTTMWTVASMAFFQQAPIVFFECLGLAGLFSRRPHAPALAGLGFAMGAFVRPTAAIPLALVGLLYLTEGRRPVRDYVLGAALPVCAIIVQNRWIWGTWLTGGYSYQPFGFHGNVPKAMNALLFGWWRGLLVYSPVLIFGFIGLAMALRRRDAIGRRLVVLGVSSLATIVVYSRFTTWWNGLNQFGYRYLLEVVPFLIVLAAYAVWRAPRFRPFAYGLGIVSIMTMTWGAGPSRGGFDGLLFAKKIGDTSIGNAWIVFLDHPFTGLLRLAGVAVASVVVVVVSRLVKSHADDSLVLEHA